MRNSIHRLAARLRSQHGTAAVEFALVLPVLIALVFGAIVLSQAFAYKNDLQQLANQGARLAAVNYQATGSQACGNTTLAASLQSYICAQAESKGLGDRIKNFAGPGSIVKGVCVTYPANAGVGDQVKVTVSAQDDVINLPLGISINPTLKGSATMRIEQAPTNITSDAAC
jgi:Flp pilus assembly protein TadG